MPRIRSVHPGLFTDEAFVSLSPLARLLFIGLWTECDDQGAFEWKPISLKMRLLPVDAANVPALLSECESANVIRRYDVGGREFGAVRNFCKYQRPKKPKAVHAMPPELRTYVASSAPSSPLEHDEDGVVLEKGEISPQMEDGGWRMEIPSQRGEVDRGALPADVVALRSGGRS